MTIRYYNNLLHKVLFILISEIQSMKIVSFLTIVEQLLRNDERIRKCVIKNKKNKCPFYASSKTGTVLLLETIIMTKLYKLESDTIFVESIFCRIHLK